ncbi:MAG: hypothetical protein ACK4NR_00245 [Micavibrio sp.]
MTKQQEDRGVGSKKSSGHGDTILDPDLTMECMNVTMGYYITLHKIVTRKLYHASQATLKRIKEVDAELKNGDRNDSEKLERYKALSGQLHKLHEVLSETQLTVEELEHIDAVFIYLPGKVKQYYEHMVSIDKELTEMIREISSEQYQEAYKRALKIIEMVQGGKNIMSGRRVNEELGGVGKDNSVRPITDDIKDISGRLEGVKVAEDGSLMKDI